MAGLFCLVACGIQQGGEASGAACDLTAIPATVRPRYRALIEQVRKAIRGRRELPDGYTFQLDSESVTLPEVAEWMSMERLCCPFLMLHMTASGRQTGWLLTVTGPAGVKPILEAVFGSSSAPSML